MRANFDEKLPAIDDPPRTDPSGEVDLEQIEYNLSLTPDQRLEQYFQWMSFIEIVREGGRRFYGMDVRAAAALE